MDHFHFSIKFTQICDGERLFLFLSSFRACMRACISVSRLSKVCHQIRTWSCKIAESRPIFIGFFRFYDGSSVEELEISDERKN